MTVEWTLVPRKGIERGPLMIAFETLRSTVREVLKAQFGDPESNL
jgi:hypothetical protein